MDLNYTSANRGILSHHTAQSSRPEAAPGQPQTFQHRGTNVLPPEEVPLLTHKSTSDGSPSVNLEERSAELTEPEDIRRKIISSKEDTESTNSQTIADNNQPSPSRIDKRHPELGRLLSTLQDHPNTNKAHKNQIEQLKN